MTGTAPVLTVLLFAVLAVLVELRGERVYADTTLSASAVVVLGAGATGTGHGLVAAAVAGACAALAACVHHGSRRPAQWVVNVLALVLAGLVAHLVLAPALALDLAASAPGAVALALCGALAGLAYAAVNHALVALAVARDQSRSVREVYATDLRWSAPHFAGYGVLGVLLGQAWQVAGVTGLAAFLVPALLLRHSQRSYVERTREDVLALRHLTAELTAARDLAESQAVALADRYRATAVALASAIDARDATTGGHVERVSALGQRLLERVAPELAADEQLALGFLLHDVGKIGIPDAVLKKPGPLTEAERVVMDGHPVIGHRIVLAAGFSEAAAQVVLSHHERWDGLGYPHGLAGEEIPRAARLFAVVDALDAMTSDRPYRAGMALPEALEELTRHAGTQFDPRAVEALLALPHAELVDLLRLDERAAEPRVITLV